MTADPEVIGQLRQRPLVSRLLTAVLRHPATMTIKVPLREFWWKVKGATISNPDIPSSVRSVLFVCLGNICRSPFAELLALRQLQAARENSIQCASAGISPSQAARSPREACEAARRFELSLDHHVPQALTPELIAAFDLIVVMDAGQLFQLREMYPAYHDRVMLLSLFDADARTSYERCNIVDPFGRSLQHFEDCYRRIDRAVTRLLASIGTDASRLDSNPAARGMERDDTTSRGPGRHEAVAETSVACTGRER